MSAETAGVHRVGARVCMRHDPRVWNNPEVPRGIIGTVVEIMRVGFDLRVEWDDGQRRGRYDGWVSWTSVEQVP